MQSKIIFTLLFMLSFSIFHDSFISLLDKNEHTEIVHYMNDESPSSDYPEFNEIHSMFHFMAIVTPHKESQIQFAKREMIPHLLAPYTPPLKKISYRPPTV